MHGAIGQRDQLLDVRRVVRARGRSDTDGKNRVGRRLDTTRFDARSNKLHHAPSLRTAANGQEDPELVTAEACHRVPQGGRDRSGMRPRSRAQHRRPGVVDALHAVQVGHEHVAAGATALRGDRCAQPIAERATVREPGEGVTGRAVGQTASTMFGAGDAMLIATGLVWVAGRVARAGS